LVGVGANGPGVGNNVSPKYKEYKMGFQVRNDAYTADNNSVQHQGRYTKTAERNRNTNGSFSSATHLKESQSSRQSAHVDSVRRSTFSNSKDEKPAQHLQTKKFTNSKVNPKNIAINKKICQTGSYFEIFRIWKESKADFNEVNIATAIHRLTKSQTKFEITSLQEDEKSLLDELKNAARESVAKFKPQEIANILWAFATLGIEDEKLFSIFANVIGKRKLSFFKPQEIANILWAFATLGIKDKKLFDDFANEIKKRNLSSFNPQDFANILWAFATLGIKDKKLFDDFANEIKKRNLSSFKPQEFSNILWAFATLGIKDKKLFDGFANDIEKKNLTSFTPQNIANILWAFATLSIKDIKLFHAFANDIEKRNNLADFAPQAIANILWAFATLDIKDKIFDDFANEIEKRNLSSFKPQEIANILWAFANLGIKDKKLFDDFASDIKRNLSFFTPQHIANILWAFATQGIKDKIIHDFAIEIEKRNLRDFKPQDFANILWAFATLGIQDKNLFNSFANEIKIRTLTEFKVQQITTILWACAVTKTFPLDLIKRLFKELPELIEKDNIALKDATQLLQVRLALKFELPNEHIPCSKKLLAQLAVAKESLTHTQHASSLFHLAVANVLSKMKVNFENEKYVDILSCDLVQDHLVIEVNGPYHYLADSSCLNGESLLKLRLLNKLGYTTIVIPYWEWNALETVESQENYLIQRLEQITPYKSPVTVLSLKESVVDI
jgi:hypothetical protein